MDNTITVESWDHFQEILFRDSFDSSIGRFRSNYVFRGLSNSKFDLKPSINRVCGNHLNLENNLIRNFRKYLNDNFINRDNFWELIALAQHHGLPTRLLDWTVSPFVAAHFATEDFSHYNADGVIWKLNLVEMNKYMPDKFMRKLSSENAYVFTSEMLTSLSKNFTTLDRYNSLKFEQGFFFFYEPPSIDDRIINQYALFSVTSKSDLMIDKWILDHPNLYNKVIIPKEKKLEIRDKLDMMNMTERVIYPGLDGLCKWLSRYYTPIEIIKDKQ